MKLFQLVLFLFSSSILIGQCVSNPSVQAGDVNPAPLYPGAIGHASFTYFENLTDYTNWSNDPVQLMVCMLHVTPLDGANSVSGTAAAWFDWIYDPSSNCLQGTQNQDIMGGTGGSIDVEFDISNPMECDVTTNQMGFIVNIQPAACMNGINLTEDDDESVYTCYDPLGVPTSVEEQEQTNLNISLFPNPATKHISLDVNSKKAFQNANIIITNIFGKTVKEVNSILLNQGANSYQLNIENLANGTYFISIENEEGKMTSLKFVKTEE